MYKFAILFIILFASLSPAAAENNTDMAPWNFILKERKEPMIIVEQSSFSTMPRDLMMSGIRFFSNYISPVDGDRCRMYPTCASYGYQAFAKHGFLIGFVMTADRLIHESNEMDYAPLIKKGPTLRYYDPVSHNDFWWAK
jgi:uncharacterized protein